MWTCVVQIFRSIYSGPYLRLGGLRVHHKLVAMPASVVLLVEDAHQQVQVPTAVQAGRRGYHRGHHHAVHGYRVLPQEGLLSLPLYCTSPSTHRSHDWQLTCPNAQPGTVDRLTNNVARPSCVR